MQRERIITYHYHCFDVRLGYLNGLFHDIVVVRLFWYTFDINPDSWLRSHRRSAFHCWESVSMDENLDPLISFQHFRSWNHVIFFSCPHFLHHEVTGIAKEHHHGVFVLYVWCVWKFSSLVSVDHIIPLPYGNVDIFFCFSHNSLICFVICTSCSLVVILQSCATFIGCRPFCWCHMYLFCLSTDSGQSYVAVFMETHGQLDKK